MVQPLAKLKTVAQPLLRWLSAVALRVSETAVLFSPFTDITLSVAFHSRGTEKTYGGRKDMWPNSSVDCRRIAVRENVFAADAE